MDNERQEAPNRKFRILVAALVLVLIGLLAFLLKTVGVGLPESDETKIEKAVETYFFAAAEGDGETACSLVYDEFGITTERECRFDYEDLGVDSGLRGAEVDRVRISGDDAYAYLDTGQEVVLKKVDGDWLLDR